MAKTSGALLAFGASGQVGKTMVISKWKGRQYVRRHVVPSNPQTAEQTITRNCFSFLNSVYKVMPSLVTDVWEAYAKGLVMTGRNAFIKQNLPVLRDQANLDAMIMSPGALGGLPPLSSVATGGVDTITIVVTPPTVLPVGWSIVGAIAAIIRDQDPDTGVLFNVTATEDDAPAYSIAFAGLGAHAWQCFGWLKWLRPDGQFAYSPSLCEQESST